MQVYCLTNKANGKKYVGKTMRLAKTRWTNHQYFAKKGKRSHFCDAIRKYGPDSFVLEVLAEATSESELNDLERQYIRELNTTNPAFGYNSRDGGEGGAWSQEARRRSFGYRHSEATREQMSKSQMGKGNRLGHRTNPEIDASLPSQRASKRQWGSGPAHGRNSTYRRGCRCPLCKRAHARTARNTFWRGKRGINEQSI